MPNVQRWKTQQLEKNSKIPSASLNGRKKSSIFTRSQCPGNNQCRANYLVHTRRKRRSKTAVNDHLDLSLNSTDHCELTADQQLDKQIDDSLDEQLTTHLNYSRLSDRCIDEIVQSNLTSCDNHYENFSDDLSESSPFNQPSSLTSQSSIHHCCTYPFLIGFLIVFLLSIYVFSTNEMQQQTSTNYGERIWSFLEIIKDALDRYADKIGFAQYASELAGERFVSIRCTRLL